MSFVFFRFTARPQLLGRNSDVRLCFHFLIPFPCLTVSHVLFMFTARCQMSGRNFNFKLCFHFLIPFPCLPRFQVHSKTPTVREKCFDVRLCFHFLIPFSCLTVFRGCCTTTFIQFAFVVLHSRGGSWELVDAFSLCCLTWHFWKILAA